MHISFPIFCIYFSQDLDLPLTILPNLKCFFGNLVVQKITEVFENWISSYIPLYTGHRLTETIQGWQRWEHKVYNWIPTSNHITTTWERRDKISHRRTSAHISTCCVWEGGTFRQNIYCNTRSNGAIGKIDNDTFQIPTDPCN